MIENPDWYVAPTWYQRANGIQVMDSFDPLGNCIKAAADGESIQALPGELSRARGPFGGKKRIHICGWGTDALLTTLLRDEKVGSSDAFILGPGDAGFVLERLIIQADDRSGVKTTSGVGQPTGLIDCMIRGKGDPHHAGWKDDSKWGAHTYDTANWTEVRVWKYSIFNEHGNYHHNIQGNHNYANGGAAMLGGCDIFVANRMNEGAVGKGDINIVDRYTEDVCIGQGGSALTFRGGMPTSKINMTRWICRLGCKAALVDPFNQNICGAFSCDEADETAPGKGDAAWPGGTAEVNFDDCDIEIGTVYPGRTGMIRSAVVVSAAGLFTMKDTRIAVTRAKGAYPIALEIWDTTPTVQISGDNEILGQVKWHPGSADEARYLTWADFQAAHPECFD